MFDLIVPIILADTYINFRIKYRNLEYFDEEIVD